MKSTISVVIPTHNRPTGLALSLKSILGQTCLPAEIIVVDDGSFPVVEDSIFDGFPTSIKCTLLRNEQPKGGNNARNRGIKAATGDYIAFLDDDDQFKPEKIQVVAQAIEANPSVDVFYHPAHIHMVNENLSYYSKPYQFKSDDDIFQLLLVSNRIGGTPMTVVRKQTLLDVGLFDEEMPAMQDYELWLRLAKNNCEFHLINEALTDYEQATKKKSITKSYNAVSKARSLIDAKYEVLYDQQIRKEIMIARSKSDILRALLNDSPLDAFKISFKAFLKHRSLQFLASASLALLGTRTYFKLYTLSRT